MNELQAQALNDLAGELDELATSIENAGDLSDDPEHMAAMFRLQAEDHRYHARKILADEEMDDDDRHRLQRTVEVEHLQLEAARRKMKAYHEASKNAKRARAKAIVWVVIAALAFFSVGSSITLNLLEAAQGGW